MVMTLNQDEIWKMKKYAEDLGVEFRFDPLLNPRLDGSKEPCKLRISPEEVVKFDLGDEKRRKAWKEFCERFLGPIRSDNLYVCSAGRTSFHIDPYGELSVCIISRSQTYHLPSGSFREGWYNFIPSEVLSLKESGDYKCSKCDLGNLCNRCPGWSELETGNPEMPVEYLCRVAHLRAGVFGTDKMKKIKGVN